MITLKHSIIALSVLASTPLMAAQPVTAKDVADAQVITVTTSAVNGFVNIANGRNCLAADSKGQPSLVTCEKGSHAAPVTKTVHVIQLKQGLCLSDDGRGPVLKTCNSLDPSQQWTALDRGPTEVKNAFSGECLTAAGLNKAVKVDKCNGSYTQSWKLPQ